ncbi:hypothetical protein DOTSEDRAFT_69389 [Dothistroma septosporum NZE10]|uniref:Uncharacterized protein n=1 Tax=Dothistroma septosporum (strain NZE10 / CBS 128990) TaxID=675120 RepID=N1PYG4_DOTSN|nr:hypothetical protein DOTSEDRAFT_69389 [Dothistroma septosporum NZE10]
MRGLSCAFSLFAFVVTAALANTEKTIFIAPSAIILPHSGASLNALQLDTLTPADSALRTAIPVLFPSADHPKGHESWYLLRGLKAGQRHEIRICWAAIQPTEFWLDVYNITHVFDTPNLIQSLAAFAEEQASSSQAVAKFDPSAETILLLHVRAAADYFTTNRSLMLQPEPVDVDIILDPYLLNVFPASLLSTAIYLVVLAVGGWYLSGKIWRLLQPNSESKIHQE